MKVLIISYHAYNSSRKAGFHFIAEELARVGHDVSFVTSGLSLVSKLRRDHRYILAKQSKSYLGFKMDAEHGVRYFSPIGLVHPFGISFKSVERIVNSVLKYNSIPDIVYSELIASDIIIVESCAGLIWLDLFIKRHENVNSKIIYRVSDDLQFLGANELLISAENRLINTGAFSIVSCPTDVIASGFHGAGSNVFVQQHGIDSNLYDTSWDNPYARSTAKKNVIYAGVSTFDAEVCNILVENFPDIDFHFIGKCPDLQTANNCNIYGVLPFNDTVRYIVHADVGLQTKDVSDTNMFKHSLKVLQYTYSGLPIVGPTCLDTGWGNYFGYDSRSRYDVCEAFSRALEEERSDKFKHHIQTWSALVKSWFN